MPTEATKKAVETQIQEYTVFMTIHVGNRAKGEPLGESWETQLTGTPHEISVNVHRKIVGWQSRNDHSPGLFNCSGKKCGHCVECRAKPIN